MSSLSPLQKQKIAAIFQEYRFSPVEDFEYLEDFISEKFTFLPKGGRFYLIVTMSDSFLGREPFPKVEEMVPDCYSRQMHDSEESFFSAVDEWARRLRAEVDAVDPWAQSKKSFDGFESALPVGEDKQWRKFSLEDSIKFKAKLDEIERDRDMLAERLAVNEEKVELLRDAISELVEVLRENVDKLTPGDARAIIKERFLHWTVGLGLLKESIGLGAAIFRLN